MRRTRGVRLGDVVEVTMGQAPTGDTYNEERVGLPLIAGAGDFGETVPEAKKYTSRPTKVCRSGDIVMSIRATIGTKVTADHDYCLGRGVAALRAGEAIDMRYLWHWLTQNERELASKGRGATFPQISRSDIADMTLRLPPLDEQRRVAAILDKADALRQKRRRAITLLDTLTQSIFLEMFGDPLTNNRAWPTALIGDLVARIDSGWSPVCLDGPAADDAWGVLKLSAVTTGQYLAAEQKALPPQLDPRPALEVREGDVLFTRKNTRDLVAATALVGPTRTRLMLSDLIFRLVPGPDVLAPFLWAALSYPTLRASIQSLVGGAAGSMPNISKERLRSVTLIKPNMDAQGSFATRLSHHRNIKTRGLQSLDRLDRAFASLQHRAFSGQL